jgi:hypothetical protein
MSSFNGNVIEFEPGTIKIVNMNPLNSSCVETFDITKNL